MSADRRGARARIATTLAVAALLVGDPGGGTAQVGTAGEAAAPLVWELVLPLGVDAVWAAWTEPAMMEEWFAPEVEVEMRPGGRYGIHFFPGAEPGLRGAEWSELLAVVPERMLRFTWYAPPHLRDPDVQRSTVTVRFAALGPTKTRLVLEHDGWVAADGWPEVRDYFAEAWPVVLDRLAHRAAVGPWPWNAAADSGAADVARPRPIRLGTGGPPNPVPPGFRTAPLVRLYRGPAAGALDRSALLDAMGGHGQALGALMAKGTVSLAWPLTAPAGDGLIALAVFPGSTVAEVRALMDRDPAVVAGVLVYDVVEWWLPPTAG